jgi:hypothetical protein
LDTLKIEDASSALFSVFNALKACAVNPNNARYLRGLSMFQINSAYCPALGPSPEACCSNVLKIQDALPLGTMVVCESDNPVNINFKDKPVETPAEYLVSVGTN